MRGKCLVKRYEGHGFIRNGIEMPHNAVYGTTPDGIKWMCVDLNLYPDGKSIDVLIYNKRVDRWRMKRLDSGSIYDVLIKYLTDNDLFGTDVKYSYRLRNTFQSTCPTGKKTKAVGLKQANRLYGQRGDGAGVTDKGFTRGYTWGGANMTPTAGTVGKSYPNRDAYVMSMVASAPYRAGNKKDGLSEYSKSVTKYGMNC